MKGNELVRQENRSILCLNYERKKKNNREGSLLCWSVQLSHVAIQKVAIIYYYQTIKNIISEILVGERP